MKIGIDLRLIAVGNSGGISLLIKGVLERLFVEHPDDTFIVFCTVFNRGLLDYQAEHVRFFTLPISAFFAELDRIAVEENIDVLFRSYPMEDTLQFPLEKQIFLVPDIQHEIFPEFFAPETLRSRRLAFNRAFANAGAIGTLSLHACQTIREHISTKGDNIFLMSPALQAEHRHITLDELSDAERALIPQGDFFLYPANLWPHKNHQRVLQAFERFLKQTRRRVTFVFTGHPDGWAELQAANASLPIKHLGFVRPQLLRLLFERSQALVFFSLFEGFGMPLLEAFDAGTPVICSNTTSLPEVGRDAVLSCDPTDVQAISDLMIRIDQDAALRADLIARGRQRLQEYTWEQSAQNLFEACERVATWAEELALSNLVLRESLDNIAQQTVGAQSRVSASDSELAIAETENLPLVSIITPSYNQGRFLKRTIESVLQQGYPNIEYIVIDGGSTDESLEILQSYNGQIEWISEPDKGQTDAINKGFARSHGEIRAYLNSDDVLQPDAVECIVAYFQQHADCDLVYGRANYIDEHDTIIGVYNTAEYSFWRLMQDNCICQPAAFWRTRVADLIGPFDEKLHYVMDYDYWLRIDRAGGQIQHIPETLAASRLYPETKTLSARDRIFEEVFAICQAHAGYVDLNYFYGLWHYLIWEKDTGWPRRFRKVPLFYQRMAYLHHKWHHRRRYTAKYVIVAVARRVKRRMPQYFGLVYRLLKPLWPTLTKASGRALLYGFWPDNWLGPNCKIPIRNEMPGQKLRLAGIAPVPMTLTISLQGKVVGQYALPAGTYEEISFDIEASTGRNLVLSFSQHIVDAAWRQLSFLVQETNLFTERDIM